MVGDRRMPEIIEPTSGRPTRVGDYVIHRLIGEGGMARVYEGEEVLSHRPVAIKVLRTELVHSDELRRRFLAEMKILSSLDHANIVRCLACTQWDERPVMVLELLEGWTLREMLAARQAIAWPEMVRYAVQIAKALRAAHSRNPPVVHRDLKPENVIVLTDGRVKVMDFGIAKILQSMSGATSHAVGTLQYMSPEHIDARPVDGRSDLFALGLLMWEMLAGKPPFEGSSPRALIESVCSNPTPRLPDHVRRELPPHIEALIDRLLAKEPGQRPANAGEVIARLNPWTKPGQTSRGATQVQPMPPPSSRAYAAGTELDPERERSLGEQVDERMDAISGGITRFADATSALIVRVLLGLLVLPAAAVGFVGAPLVLALLWLVVLNGAITLEQVREIEWVEPGALIVAVLAALVFVRACWAHRRPSEPGPLRKPWLVLGVAVLGAWIATMALELGSESDLSPAIHGFCLTTSFAWLVLSASWLAGRVTSRLFRRLERGPVREQQNH